jgi:hypothetical protein
MEPSQRSGKIKDGEETEKKYGRKKKKKEFAPRISVIFPEMSEITIEMASVRIYRDKLVIYQLKVNVI